MSENLREIILASIRYEPVNCPDAGPISMLPYLSSQAMDVMDPEIADTTQLFRDFYEASAEEGCPDFSTLSEPDIDAIAEFYCNEQGCLHVYKELRQKADAFTAFQTALCSTEAWKQWDRDRRRFIQQIQLTSKAWMSGINKHVQDTMKIVRQMERFRIPALPSYDLPSWITQRHFLLEAAASQLKPSVLAATQLEQSIDASLKQWKTVSVAFERQELLGPAITSRLANLDSMVQRSREVSKILTTVLPLQDSITRMLEFSGSTSRQFETLGEMANQVVNFSNEIVFAANRHFCVVDRPRGQVQPIYPDHRPELVDAEERIEEFYELSQQELHEDTSESIILTKDSLILIKEQFGATIQEHLAPYAPVLDRLRYLAKPESFVEVLRRFGKGFGNRHWKSLWDTIGDKYKPRPEQIAQSILASFVEGTCYGLAFVGREIGSGDGYIDLLVNFLGYNYIVEIKIVGAGWGIGAAKDGLDQLDAYMATYEDTKAYLVVFDGRKTNSGEQLNNSYELRNGTVEVIVVRAYYDAPTN